MPAMRTTRSLRKNRAIPSRASPLPQDCAAACRCPCGSWLACDANNAVTQEKQGDTLASKPAPTGLRSRLQVPLWELACLRCEQRGQSGKTGRYPREQARSHRTAKPLAGALVGAGLPAMQSTWSVRKNRAIPSRASPLPQDCTAACRCPCGSWIACDANNAVSQEKQGDTLASKPAPTGLRSRLQVPLWELACLRCKRRGQSGKTGRYPREQARSHRTAKPLAGALVGAGLPAMQTTRSVRKNRAIPSRASPLPQNGEAACRCPCGSWLACDANNAVSQEKQGDIFASKPAPTGLRSRLQVPLWELVCLRCEQRGQSGKTGRYPREQARSHRTAKPLAGALVGAGLPAMQTTRSVRKNRAIPSRASPLPQDCEAACRCPCGIS